ncbi:UDP-glucose dehydrogenase family protein [Effusibacillus lacus]|uniref:UDP-glucose 6-dehydrogenase n=1 Tax=Effusibacillus lacus TaxID=1348429 RepID=A0A292YIY7_9BACL|nr:UDP-glucose/GDP-mannose dehydrogenase family protein [Effusibacillus lacus]TCS69786.1 UDP-glucose dehydrogenase [Effusibacillus lacus]GAX88869.1 UDP-glucose 6-dehydrogenase [Effusibacillus lacus]
MRICVVGAGYVGLVSAAVFADWGHDVVCLDNDPLKIGRIRAGNLPVYEPGLPEMVSRNMEKKSLRFTTDWEVAVKDRELVMVAVGTPPGEDGHPNLTALWNVVKSLKASIRDHVLVAIKSTVPVGTCAAVSRFLNEDREGRFDIISAPEFLRQGSAINDFMSPDRMVIGCRTEAARQSMKELFEPLDCPVIFTDWQSSEMIKYAANAYLAMKISFINTIANLCEEADANIYQVALGIGLDRRIGPAFLKPGIGFGGSCLPKDTKALVALGETYGVNVSLFQEVLRINHEQRVRIVKKLEARLEGLAGKRIAVLGLAFKANTNDVREAPALAIIHQIVQAGGQVVAYDPVVDMKDLSPLYGFTPAEDAYQAVTHADAAVLLTEWDEFYGLELERVRELMNQPLLVDGRNLFAPQVMRQLGFHYIPVGISEEHVANSLVPTA